MRWLPLFALPALAAVPTLRDRLDSFLATAPEAQRAFWGIAARDLRTGQSVYARNDDHLFVPASNTKLFTTALALTRLGPDYRFTTTITAERAPDPSGTLAGDLRFVGGGDPTLTSRPFPYAPDATPGDPLAAVQALADQVVARGVHTVQGDIVGDDTAYPYEPYPTGWAQDDALYDYGAPVSALTLNDNVVTLSLRPGEAPGAPAHLQVTPALEPYTMRNEVRTASGPTDLTLSLLPHSGELLLRGTIAPDSPPERENIAVPDPALFAARALYDALLCRGIRITGRPVARHADQPTPTNTQPATELARRQSPPLWQILQTVDKVSQNLYAELVLREVARQRRGIGSRKAALAEEADFLKEIGISPDEYRFHDGSGLSRLTLVTPAATVALLAALDRSPHRDVWHSFLPVGGRDGSLRARFADQPDAPHIQAKTGGLTHVFALSGYADGPAGPLAFSIMVNNEGDRPAAVRAAIDSAALLLAR